jgi:hypothetical protein
LDGDRTLSTDISLPVTGTSLVPVAGAVVAEALPLGPLDQLAKDIQEHLAGVTQAYRAADYHRFHAGRMLLEARRLLEAEHDAYRNRGKGSMLAKPPTWKEWTRKHFRRSSGDIRKCLVLAKSDNPQAAIQAAKERNRATVAKHRDIRKERSALTVSALSAAEKIGTLTLTTETRVTAAENLTDNFRTVLRSEHWNEVVAQVRAEIRDLIITDLRNEPGLVTQIRAELHAEIQDLVIDEPTLLDLVRSRLDAGASPQFQAELRKMLDVVDREAAA